MTHSRKLGAEIGCRRFGQFGVTLMALSGGLALALAGAACNTMPMGNLAGSDSFEAPAGAPLPDVAAAEGGVAEVARDIEEADIVKVVGDKLYALNHYKGLLIVDVANPDAPVLRDSLELRGRGIEMYVLGTMVYVVTSADLFYGGMGMGMGGGPAEAMPMMADSGALMPDFEGSQLTIVNVSDPAAPSLEGKINLAGYASDSRRVGDVIYVVGTTFSPWYGPVVNESSDEEVEEGFVASVNVADPDDILAVDRKTFSGNSLAIHVSQDALFAASHEYDYEEARGFTRVQAVDISDPAGAIVLRGTVDVPGYIENRFFMDDFEGVFRIATQSAGFGFAEVRLFTYDLSDLDHITALGDTQIIEGESLRAVRFDGTRGYAVTFFQVDPLFVLDLSDPAHPAVTGALEVPGFSTHIEPRGNRLIAVGIDDTDGRRPAVAYYDVEDPAHPSQLGRVVLGPPGSFTESEAVYDEKAFKVIDELGLIVIPFKHVDYGNWPPSPGPMPLGGEPIASEAQPDEIGGPTCLNAVQLVDFSDAALTQRGWFEHRGWVQRVGVIGDRLFALSQIGLQTVNIADRDAPVKAGETVFFTDEDMPRWIDDCEGYFPPFEWPPIDPGLPFIIQIFLNGDLCGAGAAIPATALTCCLCLAKVRAGRRRTR